LTAPNVFDQPPAAHGRSAASRCQVAASSHTDTNAACRSALLRHPPTDSRAFHRTDKPGGCWRALAAQRPGTVSNAAMPTGSTWKECFSCVQNTIRGPPKTEGSSRVPTLTMIPPGAFGERATICTPHLPQNSRVGVSPESSRVKRRGSPFVYRNALASRPTNRLPAPPEIFWQVWHKQSPRMDISPAISNLKSPQRQPPVMTMVSLPLYSPRVLGLAAQSPTALYPALQTEPVSPGK